MFYINCAKSFEAPTPEYDVKKKKILVVPDPATYLFYLSQWTPSEKFPIFIGKSKYVEKFASVYNNGENEVLYLENRSVGIPTEKMIYQTIIAAQCEHDLSREYRKGLQGELRTFYNDNNISPKGLVVTNLQSPEWPAAVALAAHHHQILDFYQPPSRPFLGYSQKTMEQVRDDVISILDKWGFPYMGIGEGIDAITIALDMPYSYGGGFALDDAINREELNSSQCFAYTGRLMDMGLGLAVYQAMCSIFLSTSRALFFDKWPRQWGRSLAVGCWLLRPYIPCVIFYDDLKKWRAATGNLNPYDLIFVNASGNPDGWSGGKVEDIPESVPAVVFFAHSSSAAKPFDENTIAGRFLRNGAFIYYGAISEPYAASFNRAEHVVQKWVNGAFFAHAAQQKETLQMQYNRPWKLMYIGDPLYYARFQVHDSDQAFYQTMKDAQTAFSGLEFNNAKNILREYLSAVKQVNDNLFYFEISQRLLRKIYDFVFLENILGIQMYKNNMQELIFAWVSDYPNALKIKADLYKNEEALSYYYEKEFENIGHLLQKNTYYYSFWMSVMSEIRQRKCFPPVWKVAGPFKDAKKTSEKDVVDAIIQSTEKDLVSYNNSSFQWKILEKDSLSNQLELNINSDSDDDIWGAYFAVDSEEDQTINIRYVSQSFAKIYCDKKEIAVHSDTGNILNHTLYLTKGVHYFLVVFYPSYKKPVKMSLRLMDERFLPLQKINYIK